MSVDPQTLHAETFAEISELIDRDGELIVEVWLAQVAEDRPQTDPSYRQLMRDQMPGFLKALAVGLRRSDTGQRGPHRLSAVEHGEQRWTIGWRLADVVRDYQALRIVLVEHLSTTLLRPLTVHEVLAIGLLLDEAIAAAVVMFVGYEERRLGDAERRLRDIMNAAPDGIIAVDADGVIRLANPAAERVFAASAGGLSARSFSSLFNFADSGETPWWWPPPQERAAAPLRRQIPARRGDGATVDLDVAISRFDGQADPLAIAVVRDVSAQKKLDEELIRYAGELESLNRALAGLTAQAAAANQAKSDFLAKMSHDIRSPLTAVLGYVELLSMQIRDPDQLHMVQTIQRNAHFLVDILNDVLDLSKIEAGKLAVEQVAVSPAAVVAEIVELLSLPAAEKGIRLVTSVAPRVPATIVSDPKRLKQILMNLVVNAIKFTDRGEVRISVERDARRGELCFSVVDTGVGMTPQDLAHVFEPFSQGAAGSAQGRGTGLGLTISRHLAELLGGHIAAQSRPGHGSTLRLILPLKLASTLPEAANSPPPLDEIARLPGPCHILIADDQADHRTVVADFLTSLGATVEGVQSGRRAVDTVIAAAHAGDSYDLVLMDMRMADLDGEQATALIRAAGIKVPIIALTASVMPGDAEKCLAAGCNEFLSKPIDFNLLAERVAQYVHRDSAN